MFHVRSCCCRGLGAKLKLVAGKMKTYTLYTLLNLRGVREYLQCQPMHLYPSESKKAQECKDPVWFRV